MLPQTTARCPREVVSLAGSDRDVAALLVALGRLFADVEAGGVVPLVVGLYRVSPRSEHSRHSEDSALLRRVGLRFRAGRIDVRG